MILLLSQPRLSDSVRLVLLTRLVFLPDKDQKFIYMVDAMNGEVRIVERASKETLGRFGRPGRQVGMFTVVHNIAVDRQGNIFTSEVNTGQRVQKFRRTDMQD